MIGYNGLSCCGVKEITGLSTHSPKQVQATLRRLLNNWRYEADFDYNTRRVWLPRLPAFLLFTQARLQPGDEANDLYGDQFAQLITDLQLGDVIAADEKINPNSQRLLTPYLWRTDEDAIREYMRSRRR